MTKEINFKNFSNRMKGWWNYFTAYEKWWFFIFTAITIAVAIIIPEETTNGIDGTVLTIIYLFNTILGILCELLTSKQNKLSLLLYIVVEVIEIVKLICLMALFSSMVVSLCFWLPMHIITYINWAKHGDKKDKNVTKVRSLNLRQSILLFAGIAVWTIGMGYLFATISPDSEIFSGEAAKVAVCYIDACVSALAIANGVLLYFRFKENWIVWLVSSILGIVTYIITGLWLFIILNLGYITNTIYGYICWTKYIKAQNENAEGAPSESNAQQTSNEDSNQNQLEKISDGELKNE